MSPAPAPASASCTKAVVAIWVVLVAGAAVGAVGVPVKPGEATGAFAVSSVSSWLLRTRSVPPEASWEDRGTVEKVLAPPTVWLDERSTKAPLPASGMTEVALPEPSSPLPT